MERFILAALKGGPMLRLRDIMTRDVVSAAPDMTIRDAMELLSERHVSGAPVVDGGKVVGIFSATDLLDLLADLNDTTPSLTFRRRKGRTTPLEDVTVDEVMTRKVQSLPPDCSGRRSGRPHGGKANPPSSRDAGRCPARNRIDIRRCQSRRRTQAQQSHLRLRVN